MDLNTVAVFGASSKLGKAILQVLDSRRLSVRALIHKNLPEGDHGNTSFIHGDIADLRTVQETIRGADAVVHLATAKEDRDTFFDVSVRGAWNILEACRESSVRQVILFSGNSAQGIWYYPQPIPIDENHPLTAYPGYYAFSKVIEETMAQQYTIQYGLPVTILRPSWIFEKDDLLRHFSLLRNIDPAEPGHGFGAVSDQILRLVQRGEEHVPILTDRNNAALNRHIVHIDDAAQAFDLALGNAAAINQSFNIAAPAPFNYRVAAEYLSKKTGVPTVEIPCDFFGFEININRARGILGYAPENDFFRMADRALDFRLETPA